MRRRLGSPAAITVMLGVLVTPVPAALIVRLTPAHTMVPLGASVQIEIRADIPIPILGWGVDISQSSLILAENGPPAVGPLWSPAHSLDGDRLVGLAFPSSISGTNILLATLTWTALNVGETTLAATITPDDPTEGFALDPAGFDTAVFEPALVTVMPDPASLWLISLGTLALFKGKR